MAKDWKEYERTIAKALGLWFGCVFRRTPGSGAWGKQGQSRGYSQRSKDATGDFHGDIVAPPDAHFPFSVECKTYKEANINLFLYGTPALMDWWIQCANDARRHGKHPMLVFKENFKTPILVISNDTWVKLQRFKRLRLLRRATLTYNTKKGERSIHLFDFRQFIQTIPAKYIKHLLS